MLKGKSINVRGKGGWAVAPGALRPDGKRWEPSNLAQAFRDDTIPFLTGWLGNLIRPLRRHTATSPVRPETSDQDRVEAALRYIPNDDRDTWLGIGAALHETGWGCARSLWDAWSATSGKFDHAGQEKAWRSFDRPYNITRKTIASLFEASRSRTVTGQRTAPTANRGASPAEPKVEQQVALFDPWGRYIVPPFPLEILPPVLRHFVTVQSELIGCDRGGLAMATLAGISGAIDHRFALKMLRNGNWWESPRLWVLLVGDPSVKKTPIVRCATEELDRMQAVAFRKYKNDQAEYVAAGGNAEQFSQPPPRLTVYDTTTEKLGMILAGQDRGVLVKRDEITGWIGSMEKYASSGRGPIADRALWLQAYDGGPYAVDRVTRPDLQIANLSVSILGGIQPARMAELHGLTSDGLLQRFLPVLISGSTFPADVVASQQAERYAELLRQLVELAPLPLLPRRRCGEADGRAAALPV